MRLHGSCAVCGDQHGPKCRVFPHGDWDSIQAEEAADRRQREEEDERHGAREQRQRQQEREARNRRERGAR